MKIALTIVLLFFLCQSVFSAPKRESSTKNPYGGTKFYSKNNNYQGQITQSGRVLDKNGVQKGRIDSRGRTFDNIGRQTGTIKPPK